MATTVRITNLLAGSSSPLLASGDILPFVDVSDTTQSPQGSTVKITLTNFFANIPVPVSIAGLLTTRVGSGQFFASATATTGNIFGQIGNTGGLMTFGLESSVGGTLMTGASAYDTVLTFGSGKGLSIGVTSAARAMRISAATTTIDSTTTAVQALTATGATITKTTTQLTLAYDVSHIADFTVSSAGLLTINATSTISIVPAVAFSAGITATTAILSGLLSANAGLTVASGQTLTVTGATITGLTAASVATGTFPGVYTITGAVTLSAALTYGGVTLSNAVTGTGNMVLSAGPTFTGTVTTAAVAASDNVLIAATKKLGLNASGTTYINEPASNQFELVVGGTSTLRSPAVGCLILASAGGSVGFFNGSGTTKQTVTGSKGANAALASLLTALAAYGLVTDSST